MRTLYRRGRVWTMDARHPAAEAFVVESGRFLAVGTMADCEPLVTAGCRIVDLGGRTVLPGLIDSHVHFAWFSLGLVAVNLDGVPSLQAALELIRKRAESLPPGSWIRAQGFDLNSSLHWPTRSDLDAVVPDHPVAVGTKDGHSLWVNTAALHAAAITFATPSPPGGQILRDEHGEPTGILQETAAELLQAAMPPPTQKENLEAIRQGLAHANMVGVTSAHDMDPVDCFRALQTLRLRDELTVRFFKQIPRSALDAALQAGLSTGFGDQWLRVGCLKLFADGSLGSRTAHMLDPYEDASPYRGVPTHTPEELTDLIGRAVRGNVAVAIHAIGDAANRTVLNVFEQVAEESRQRGLRHRVEHAQILSQEDIHRFAELDLIVSIQPSHAPSDRYLADRNWGKRSRLAYAFRSLKETGVRLALGSDVPVEPLDPLAGIHAAVWRKRMSEPASQPWYFEQRLTVAEAVRGFTLDAAYASSEEHLKGSITPGKLADFVVLTHDIRSGNQDEEVLRVVRPQATVTGGRLVYGQFD